jgi:hypothetical protein
MTPTPARVIYPVLPDPLTPGDLQQLFSPSFDDRKWAPTVTRTVESQVALLVQLKIFQTTGRFLRPVDVPHAAIEYVAYRMGVEFGSHMISPTRTLFRHRKAVLKHLKVVPWGTEARALAMITMCKTAQVRTDPADIINSAIDALIRRDFELPTLVTLRRMAGTVHSSINALELREYITPRRHTLLNPPPAAPQIL